VRRFAFLILLVAGAAGADEDPLKMAEEAYGQAHYKEARDLAMRAVGREPIKAWRLAGSASCLLKDRAAALDALTHLPQKSDAEGVRFACQHAEVEITDEDAAIYASKARADVEKAQAAYSAAKYADAKKFALAATVTDGKLAAAWRLLGTASCWTKDKATAQRASEHLQPVDQEVIRSVCARTLGVQLKNSRVLR
jgi:hypothetical protein